MPRILGYVDQAVDITLETMSAYVVCKILDKRQRLVCSLINADLQVGKHRFQAKGLWLEASGQLFKNH